jgi:hypothetical protein
VCSHYAGLGKRGRAVAPGYGLDTSDGGTWALRRPDGTAVSYFGAWGATRKAVERAARKITKEGPALTEGGGTMEKKAEVCRGA